MTINDIRRYLYNDCYAVGDTLDNELDKDTFDHDRTDYSHIKELALVKWAIDEVCYAMQYDLIANMYDEPECIYDNVVKNRDCIRHIYIMEGSRRVYADEITIPDFKILSALLVTTDTMSDYALRAASKWYKQSNLFNLLSSVAITTGKYIYQLLGGVGDDDYDQL